MQKDHLITPMSTVTWHACLEYVTKGNFGILKCVLTKMKFVNQNFNCLVRVYESGSVWPNYWGS